LCSGTGPQVFEQRPHSVSFADGPKLAPRDARYDAGGVGAREAAGEPPACPAEAPGAGEAAAAAEKEDEEEEDPGCAELPGGAAGAPPADGARGGNGALGPGAVTWEGSFVLCSFIETCVNTEASLPNMRCSKLACSCEAAVKLK